jgi:LmbE family N-acetylglucosaminyl deacetylase
VGAVTHAFTTPTTVVISPHLDDAVLSAWSVLSSSEPIRVVTVYAGIPAPGFVTDLDRAHGAHESAAWLRRRRAEDIAALALADCEPVHLDLLEVQFPAYGLPVVRERVARDPSAFLSIVVQESLLRTDPDEIVRLVHDDVPSDAVVYGPGGIGRHPDHRDVGEAVVRLLGRVREVRLYADSPYYLFRGLPSWLNVVPNSEADEWCVAALPPLVRDCSSLIRRVVRLDDEALESKWAALECYRTELPSIVDDMRRFGISREWMRYETFWTVGDDAT